MTLSAGEVGLALLVGAIGLIGGLLGNLIAGHYTWYEQLLLENSNEKVTPNHLLFLVCFYLIAFFIILAALIIIGNTYINL